MYYGKDDVAVGQEVGIARRASFGLTACTFGTVTKINGHGHIFVETPNGTSRFNKHGDSYQYDYGPRLICADDLRKELLAETRKKDQRRAALELQEAVQQGFAGNGRFWATGERIDEIKIALAALEKLVD